MIKLKFSKPKFVIYNEGKVTLCMYQCTKYRTSDKKVLDTFKVTGKAVQSDADTLDPRMGRILADSRAKKLAYKHCKMSPYIYDVWMTRKREVDEQISFFDQMNYLYKQEIKHIENVIDEN